MPTEAVSRQNKRALSFEIPVPNPAQEACPRVVFGRASAHGGDRAPLAPGIRPPSAIIPAPTTTSSDAAPPPIDLEKRDGVLQGAAALTRRPSTTDTTTAGAPGQLGRTQTPGWWHFGHPVGRPHGLPHFRKGIIKRKGEGDPFVALTALR